MIQEQSFHYLSCMMWYIIYLLYIIINHGRPSSYFSAGVTKAMVCAILSLG